MNTEFDSRFIKREKPGSASRYSELEVGDLVRWESVLSDSQEEVDSEYGIILELKEDKDLDKYHNYTTYALVQFYDEHVWINACLLERINEQ